MNSPKSAFNVTKLNDSLCNNYGAWSLFLDFRNLRTLLRKHELYEYDQVSDHSSEHLKKKYVSLYYISSYWSTYTTQQMQVETEKILSRDHKTLMESLQQKFTN